MYVRLINPHLSRINQNFLSWPCPHYCSAQTEKNSIQCQTNVTMAMYHDSAAVISRRFHGRYILILNAEPTFHQAFNLKLNTTSSRPGYCEASLPWWSDTFITLRNQLLCCSTMNTQRSTLQCVCVCVCVLPSRCPPGRAVKWLNMGGSEESAQRNTTSVTWGQHRAS